MQYILALLSVPFFYSNYKILVSDLKYKKIPNKYLLYLLALIPFYYIYLFLYFPEINYLFFLWQIIITFTISFILYIFWIWAAWNAKYLLILSLLVPYIWIIPFIWNIILLVITYLILYFIWFYFWKCIIIKWYAKSLIWNIKLDLHEKWKNYKQWWNTFFIILKWIVTFLILFVSIRLLRIYLFNEIFTWDTSRFELIWILIQKYNIYLLFSLILFFLWLLYLIKKGINKLTSYFSSKYNIDTTLTLNIFLIILFFLLTSFLIIEFFINPAEIINHLYKIFTLYIILYLIFKMLFYSYKITFWIYQSYNLDINYLNIWDIIDKKYLVELFWKQNIFYENSNKKWLLYKNPIKYLKNINNPLDKESITQIKYVYKEVNNYHNKVKTSWYNKNNTIKMTKAISFWLYIFIWFLITYLLWNKIIIYLIDFIIYIVKNIFIN